MLYDDETALRLDTSLINVKSESDNVFGYADEQQQQCQVKVEKQEEEEEEDSKDVQHTKRFYELMSSILNPPVDSAAGSSTPTNSVDEHSILKRQVNDLLVLTHQIVLTFLTNLRYPSGLNET